MIAVDEEENHCSHKKNDCHSKVLTNIDINNNNKPSLKEFKNDPDILENCIYKDLLFTLDGIRQELPNDIDFNQRPPAMDCYKFRVIL